MKMVLDNYFLEVEIGIRFSEFEETKKPVQLMEGNT